MTLQVLGYLHRKKIIEATGLIEEIRSDQMICLGKMIFQEICLWRNEEQQMSFVDNIFLPFFPSPVFEIAAALHSIITLLNLCFY